MWSVIFRVKTVPANRGRYRSEDFLPGSREGQSCAFDDYVGRRSGRPHTHTQ